MGGRLLWLCLLGSLLCISQAKNKTCLTSASTCAECINSGRECGWSMDPLCKTRCNTMKEHQRAGCAKSQVYNPKCEILIKRNKTAYGHSNFLEPQHLSLKLRPEESLVFALKITTPRHQPELMLEATALPEAVNITFKKISSGNPMVFQVRVKAGKCPHNEDSNQPQNKTGPWSVEIKPSGFSQSAKLEIDLECQCECQNNQEPDSPACDGHGTLVCGVCLCQPPYSGSHCEIDLESTKSDASCRSGPAEPVCSGRGLCDEGFCICNKRDNPNEMYFGQFCECSNFNCPYKNGRVCNGRGICQCDQCICENDWGNTDCSCKMNPASCMSENQLICNARGVCECGTCVCIPPFTGPTCESCPTCQHRCQEYASCVECRVFGTERCATECSDYTVTLVDTKDDVPTPLCRMISQKDSCFFHFSYSRSSSSSQLTVAKTKECPAMFT
ncbi:hypothetical protein NL108_001271 [Boleophthalmus pectinirostris]|nr:hypothetical protein NL108_001271 [Boleophthalmus pectinirostris]